MKFFNVIHGLNIGLLSLFSIIQPVQSITLELLPETQNVNVGDSVILDVQISELGDVTSPSVRGFDFTLNYNPAILTFNSASFSGLIDLSGFLEDEDRVDDSTPGLVTLLDSSFDDPTELNAAQPSSFDLVTLNFTASGVGENSEILLTILDILDENADDLVLISVESAILVSVEPLAIQISEPNFNLISWIVFLGLTSLSCKKLIP